MSAFMCSDVHINLLASFAAHHRIAYYWQDATLPVLGEEEKTARMLQAANARSVNYRYAHNIDAQCHDDPIEYRDVYNPAKHSATLVLKQVQCFDYQACEPNDWRDSQAHALMDAIQSKAITMLPGYDAAPWGID